MALGIGDVTRKAPIVGGQVTQIVKFTFDTDYAAGGYAVTAAEFGLTTIDYMSINPVGGYVPVYNPATGKVMVFWGDNNNASDGPLIEIADGDNGVDTLVARAEVRGEL